MRCVRERTKITPRLVSKLNLSVKPIGLIAVVNAIEQEYKMSRAGEIPCVWYSKGMSFGGGLPALDNSCNQ